VHLVLGGWGQTVQLDNSLTMEPLLANQKRPEFPAYGSEQPDSPPEHEGYISPFKLKAIAMKMRHRLQRSGVLEQRQQEQQQQQQQGVPEADMTEDETPNNLVGLKMIILHPICILLISVPLGLASSYLSWGPAWTFWLNFIALMPLAKILGDATEELAASIGNDAITGLLNASFGNAVELIVAIQSLRAGLLSVVKCSLLGSVLSNILLVLGTAFLLGGLTPGKVGQRRFCSFNDSGSFTDRYVGLEKEQKFPVKGALVSMAMLLFSCMSFALPTIFNARPTDDFEAVLTVSRIGAWIVMSSYLAFLVFQLFTHRKTLTKEENALGVVSWGLASMPIHTSEGEDDCEENSSEEAASLTRWFAFGLMALTTIVVSVNSEFMVDAIESVVKECGIPQNFIGIILLPVAGNACEHASAIRFAMQDRPGLAIGIAVGSSTQVALLIVPVSVVVGWFLDQPMNLDFGCLHTAVVTLSILVVLTLLLDGRANWLKGYILICLYVFISVLYWWVPTDEISDRGWEL